MQQSTAYRLDSIYEDITEHIEAVRVTSLRNSTLPWIPLSRLIHIVIKYTDISVIIWQAVKVTIRVNIWWDGRWSEMHKVLCIDRNSAPIALTDIDISHKLDSYPMF